MSSPAPKPMSAYNTFMKETIRKLNAEKPGIGRAAFSEAAKMWRSTHPAAAKDPKKRREKKQKIPRKANAFNEFIAENLKLIKEKQPGIDHRAAFTAAVKRWTDTHPKLPSTKKPFSREEHSLHMKNETKRIREEDPTITQKEAFSRASRLWKERSAIAPVE